MNILLIDPLCKNPKFESPNIKLAYAAALLEKMNFSVDIVDFIINDFDKIGMKEYSQKRNDLVNLILENEEKYDYIYMNSEYGILSTCIEIAKKIKKSTVIVGGTYINYLYRGGIINKSNYEYVKGIDYLSVGDIEADIVYVIKHKLKKGGLTSIVNNGKVNVLDNIPFPAWHKFDINKYDGKLYLVGARGCNYNKCKFCDEKLIWGKEFRSRDANKIVEEIKWNKEKYKIDQYFFWDASITAYPHLEELCKLLTLTENKCSWTALARVSEINEKKLELLKCAGCNSIEVGIESLQDSTLIDMNKGITYDEIRKKINMIKKFDIFVEGSFLIGYPNEDFAQMKDTVEKALSMNIDFYRWHNFQLYSDFIRKYPKLINIKEWFQIDINYPNQLLPIVIKNQLAAFFEMHMATKIMSYDNAIVPDFKIGKVYLQDIYKIIYIASKASDRGKIGHNPYI